MSLSDSFFRIQRGSDNFKCKASQLSTLLRENDLLVVQREHTLYQVKYDNGTWTTVRDTDLFFSNLDGSSYKVTGESFKTLF